MNQLTTSVVKLDQSSYKGALYDGNYCDTNNVWQAQMVIAGKPEANGKREKVTGKHVTAWMRKQAREK